MFGKNFELEKLKSEIKKLKNNLDLKDKENKILKDNNKSKDEVIKDLDNNNYKEKYNTTSTQLKSLIEIDKEKDIEIEELKKKVIFLEGQLATQKVRNEKDSSNTSKPSSTNGFKKVITNRREPSNKLQGGQEGHKGSTIKVENLEELLKQPNTMVKIIDVNKTEENKNMPVETRAIVDIEITKVVTIYKYYPNNDGKYDIPLEHNIPIQYGSTIKAMCTDLMIGANNSTDSVKSFVESITNDVIKLSKGTLINWLKDGANKLKPQLVSIQKNLLNSYYVNQDESQIKINGKNSNIICTSNQLYTRLWVSKSKSRKAIEELNFLIHYLGIIIKDGTDLYNGFGKLLAQCLSHILRYLKGIYDFNPHEGAKNMAELLIEIKDDRDNCIARDEKEFNSEVYKGYVVRFKEILREWKKEWMSSNIDNNPVYEDERKLLQRFEDTKERKEILYFMKDFKIPATNNQAEADQRPVKIKQKIGKFRSVDGAICYAEIRSCINTFKKHNLSPFDMLKRVYDGTFEPI